MKQTFKQKQFYSLSLLTELSRQKKYSQKSINLKDEQYRLSTTTNAESQTNPSVLLEENCPVVGQ